jgi:TonB-dependent starch-binding outer membrane protein SusC
MARVRKCVMTIAVLFAAIVASAAQLQAQQTTGTVRGRVVESDGLTPLADVTVKVAGRTVLSGQNGFFVVAEVPAGIHTLEAALIGRRPTVIDVTVTAGAETVVEVRLGVAPFEMEALVAIGYGEQQSRDLTGVVAEVPAEAFNTGRIVSAEELIRGKVAGVQVAEANGGEPGGGMSIRIRGGTSVTSSNEPLYVIDGVPIPVGGGLSAGRNPMNFINPDDIESFTILKDASATAIYGSQGANGVVLISTKAGKGVGTTATGARVSYKGTFSGSKVAGRPDILNAAQFRAAVADRAPEQLGFLGSANTSWPEAVEQSAFGQEHTVSVAGGAEKMSFRASLGYLDQEGVIQASENERISLNLAYNQLLFDDRLSLQGNVLGARTEDRFTPGGVLGMANNFAPTQPILDPNSPFGGYFEWDDPLATNNPIGELNLVTDEGTTYRSLGNVTGEYAMPWVEGLSATARVGYLVTKSERRFFAPSINKNEIEDGSNGTVSRNNPTELGWLFDGYLTYVRSWGNEHALDLTGGYAFLGQRNDYPSFYAENIDSDLLGTDGIAGGDQYTFLTIDESRLASWFARANYALRDRYLFTATVRTDGSSKFGEGNQWGTFPSAAFAWRLSEESFMDDFEAVSDLKLRLSWGKNGNSAFPNYRQYKDYLYGDPTARVQFGDEFVTTIRPSAVDPNIKWEETTSWNLGLDYGLWNNRVWGSLELYTKKTEDLIFDVIVAGGTNLSNVVTTNVGSMKNRGIELTLNSVLAEGAGDGFRWDGNFNLAYNKNELLQINPFAGGSEQILSGDAISGGVGSFIQVLQPGEAVNSFFVYRHKMGPDGNPIVGTDLEMYEDLNGDGIINQDDRAPFNSPDPSWIFGHTSLMSWNKFDLSLTLQAQIGNYMYNNVASSTGFYDQLLDSARPSNLHASVLEYGFQNPQYFSNIYVEDASFLRLENIELGYTFRQALNGVRVFGVVQNVFTITGYDGVDPTATIRGIDNNIYPRTRTFTAGVSVQF